MKLTISVCPRYVAKNVGLHETFGVSLWGFFWLGNSIAISYIYIYIYTYVYTSNITMMWLKYQEISKDL